MKRLFGAACLMSTVFSSSVMAEEASSTAASPVPTVILDVPLQKYSSSSDKFGPTDPVKETAFETVPQKDAAIVFMPKLGTLIYTIPFADNKIFMFGQFLSKELEVGALVGYNKTKKGDASDSTVIFGPQVQWHKSLGSNSIDVLGKVYSVGVTSETPVAATGTIAKMNVSQLVYDVGFNYVIPVNKFFAFSSGVSYKMYSGKEKESGAKMEGNELSIRLLNIRAYIY